MNWTRVLSAEECAEEANKQLADGTESDNEILAGIGWALLSIAVSLSKTEETT